MRAVPFALSLAGMVALVAVWWRVTDAPSPTPVATPPAAAAPAQSDYGVRGDALITRLEERLGPLWRSDLPVPDQKPLEKVNILARYSVSGNKLQPLGDTATSATHFRSWSTVTTLLPLELTSAVSAFTLATDGHGDDRGWLTPLPEQGQWQLALDPRDSEPLTRLNTLVYQSGLLVGLGNDQLQSAEAACSTYQTAAGCLREGGVMQRYLGTFWSAEMQGEWEKSGASGGAAGLQQFVAAHPDTFLTPSAARSPKSDFASAWAAFVLTPQPQRPATLAQRKVAFFYSDPALTRLRLKMLRQISSAFPAR